MVNRELKPATLELVLPSDPIHNRIAEEVTLGEINSELIQGLIDRMIELSEGKGHNSSDTRQMVGLAATQLGVSKRVVTIDTTATGAKQHQTLEVFINPHITERVNTAVDGREGCWSCGNICGNVPRAEAVTVTALDRNGKQFTRQFEGFVARIAQHEVDHLDGYRFPDRIPKDQPERLHWVEPVEFERYRTEWQNWSILCPRQKWEELKSGN